MLRVTKKFDGQTELLEVNNQTERLIRFLITPLVDHLHSAPGGSVLHLQLPQPDSVAAAVADPGQTGERQTSQERDEESGQDVHCNSHSVRRVLASLPLLLPGPVLLSGNCLTRRDYPQSQH